MKPPLEPRRALISMGIAWVVLLGIGLGVSLTVPGVTGWPAFVLGFFLPFVVFPFVFTVLRPWYRPDRQEQWNEDRLP